MLNKKTLKDLDVKNKRVLVRVDFNVPINDGMVGDDTRIRAALPTIKYLLKQNAKVILCSHLGRPKGERNLDLSLVPVAKHLKSLVPVTVNFASDCVGDGAKLALEMTQQGEILLLENTRFHKGEKKNDPAMAKELASLADVFVNDAFGTAHRAHASNVGVAEILPSAAGFLLEKELKYLGETIANAERPFVAILGGAKVSDKIGVITNLLAKTDKILIGGGMANTFFKAQGFEMADSLVEEDAVATAAELVEKAGDALQLPVDMVIASGFSDQAEKKVVAVGDVPIGWRILDIGPDTVAAYASIIQKSKTVVWNGPMGVFEFPNFAKGTFGVAEAVANAEVVSVIGGGDSVAAIVQAGLDEKVSHISTGGGASLEMLEGKVLPGVAALADI